MNRNSGGYSRGGNRRRDNLLRREEFSFRVNEDCSEFHFCRPNKMKVDFGLLESYKSSLKCFGGYVEDDDSNLLNEKSFLRFLKTEYLPEGDSKEKVVNFDLNTVKYVKKPYSGPLFKSSENLFSWIVSNMNNLAEILSCETKFVFLRGVFAKLMKIPYGYNGNINFFAVWSNGIVCLFSKEEAENYASKKVSGWGHKIEQFLTYDENAKEVEICNHYYRYVMSAKLGPHNLLYSASTNCFNPDICDLEFRDPSSSVLIRNAVSNPSRINEFERFQSYNWCYYLLSLNVPHVLVGFRTFDGIVKLLKLYTENDLHQLGKGYWDMNVGFTFAQNALSFIEKTTKAKPGTVFSFKKKSRTSHIIAEETTMENFPPKWFMEELGESGLLDHEPHS